MYETAEKQTSMQNNLIWKGKHTFAFTFTFSTHFTRGILIAQCAEMKNEFICSFSSKFFFSSSK
jgi:hypothetical protein